MAKIQPVKSGYDDCFTRTTDFKLFLVETNALLDHIGQ